MDAESDDFGMKWIGKRIEMIDLTRGGIYGYIALSVRHCIRSIAALNESMRVTGLSYLLFGS